MHNSTNESEPTCLKTSPLVNAELEQCLLLVACGGLKTGHIRLLSFPAQLKPLVFALSLGTRARVH